MSTLAGISLMVKSSPLPTEAGSSRGSPEAIGVASTLISSRVASFWGSFLASSADAEKTNTKDTKDKRQHPNNINNILIKPPPLIFRRIVKSYFPSPSPLKVEGNFYISICFKTLFHRTFDPAFFSG